MENTTPEYRWCRRQRKPTLSPKSCTIQKSFCLKGLVSRSHHLSSFLVVAMTIYEFKFTVVIWVVYPLCRVTRALESRYINSAALTKPFLERTPSFSGLTPSFSGLRWRWCLRGGNIEKIRNRVRGKTAGTYYVLYSVFDITLRRCT